MTTRILRGDCRVVLADLPAESVHCCVTSPPYFGLRDYGHDGQIGLEQTPAEYVEQLVQVFREVRRVLRDDGTLWLNLGDSYAGYHGNKNSAVPTSATNGWTNGTNENARTSTANRDGLKAKDLIGIPWAVATALRDPYYAGRIKDINDRVWLAAMIDGEGCMFIHKRKAGTDSGARFTKSDGTEVSYTRNADTYGAGLEVANTHLAIIENCIRITGVGSVVRQEKDRRQPLYRWNVRSNECRWIIEEVYPHLVAKKHQARLLLGCPSSGERADAAHQALMGLHGGTPTDVDFKPPESLFQPGYYLRQDVIWAKSNPMPESVTDRCTKAHEYVFLLSKSPRYYFDSEAMAEPAIHAGKVVTLGEKSLSKGQANGANVAKSGNANADSVTVKDTRNRRSVWSIATQPFKEAHFATMAPELAETCIKAGCPIGGTVLDPFGGAGTTGLVADRLQRHAVLVELNPEYIGIARDRIHGDAPLFAEVAA